MSRRTSGSVGKARAVARAGLAFVGFVGGIGIGIGFAFVGFIAVAPAAAQQNLSFERGDDAWRVEAGPAAVVDSDASLAQDGERSLRIDSGPEPTRTRLAQSLAPGAITEDRVRISGHFRTDEAEAASPSLWIRIDGPDGLLYIDRARGPASAAHEWTALSLDAPLSARATRIRFGTDWRGSGSLWLDDFAVAALDPRTLPPADPAAARYLNRALDIMQRNSLNRAHIDWPEFRAAAMRHARGASRVAQAYPAVQYALGELADGHSYFMPPHRMNALEAAPVSNARTGGDPRPPRGELMPVPTSRTAGYVRIPGFAGGSHRDQVEFAQEVQGILARLDVPSTCGWIVDLRDNEGGNTWPMLTGVGPLLGDGPTGAAVYPDGRRVEHWYDGGRAGLGDYTQLRVRGEPHRLRDPDADVAVLTNGSTASAAEVLAVAFRGLPRTRSFGRATRGAITATRIFPLSDDAALVLAVAATSDRHGTLYPGAIVPDEPVAPDEQVLDAALQWLSRRASCEAPSGA